MSLENWYLGPEYSNESHSLCKIQIHKVEPTYSELNDKQADRNKWLFKDGRFFHLLDEKWGYGVKIYDL